MVKKPKKEDPKPGTAPAEPDKYIAFRDRVNVANLTSQKSMVQLKVMISEKEAELAQLRVTLYRLEGAVQVTHKLLTTGQI